MSVWLWLLAAWLIGLGVAVWALWRGAAKAEENRKRLMRERAHFRSFEDERERLGS